MGLFKSIEFLNEETIQILESGEAPQRLTCPPLSDTPTEFRDQIIKMMEYIEKKSGQKVGSGVADAAFGNLKIKLSNAIDRIKKKKLNNTYSIIIPFSVLKHMNPDKNGEELIIDILKSNGFQKGGKMAGNWNGYWYKKGKEFINASAFIFATNQIQIHFFCAEDTKDNLKFIKSNH